MSLIIPYRFDYSTYCLVDVEVHNKTDVTRCVTSVLLCTPTRKKCINNLQIHFNGNKGSTIQCYFGTFIINFRNAFLDSRNSLTFLYSPVIVRKP